MVAVITRTAIAITLRKADILSSVVWQHAAVAGMCKQTTCSLRECVCG